MKRLLVKMILVQPPATAVFVENHGCANLTVLQEGFPQPRRTGEAPVRSPERQIGKKTSLSLQMVNHPFERRSRVYINIYLEREASSHMSQSSPGPELYIL